MKGIFLLPEKYITTPFKPNLLEFDRYQIYHFFQSSRPKQIHTNIVDPDEMARNELSHQDLHCLPLFLILDWNTYLQQRMCPNSEMEESMSGTQGVKLLRYYGVQIFWVAMVNSEHNN